VIETTGNPGNSHKNLSGEHGNFVWFRLLIDALVTLELPQTIREVRRDDGSVHHVNVVDYDEFAHLCKDYYQGNPAVIIKIDEFAETYDSLKSIWWYTSEPFVYSILNKALRCGFFDILVVYHFFFRDIYQQLEEGQKKFTERMIKTYRGQAMTDDELDQIKLCQGQLICMNSFLSTSRKPEVASIFTQSSDPDLQLVLFEIEADTQLKKAQPFSEISHLSAFVEEEEILFMAGSIFRIGDIKYNEEEQFYSIRLTLLGLDDNELHGVFESQQSEMDTPAQLVTVGKILRELGDFESARRCFQRFIDFFSSAYENYPGVTRCYNFLGQIADDEENYDEALRLYNRVIEIELNEDAPDYPYIGDIHNNIGVVSYNKEDYDGALESYQKALSYKSKADDENYDSANIFNNIGNVYRVQEKWELAEHNFTRCLEIRSKLYPDNHPDIAQILTNIANLHYDQGKYDLALSSYEKVLSIESTCLTSNHTSLGQTYHAIGNVYAEGFENYQLALQNYQKSLDIFSQRLQVANSFITDIEAKIQETKQKISDQINHITLADEINL
jgi:tetratricopeptide (TPR) repeat protein